MRVPFSAAYRAFPEFDRFTNEQCRRLVARVRSRRNSTIADRYLAIITACLVAGLIVVPAMKAAWSALKGTWFERTVRGSVIYRDFGAEAVAVAVVVATGVGALLFHDRTLRRLLNEQVNRTNCPACLASLLGERRWTDSVQCGSCRGLFTLTSLGLMIEDLGPPLVVLQRGTACLACGYVIAELPIHRGTVVCPECGSRTQVAEQTPMMGTDETTLSHVRTTATTASADRGTTLSG